jgi:hypothetical protein
MPRIRYMEENGHVPWVIVIAGSIWWAYPTLRQALCRFLKAWQLECSLRAPR